MRLLLLAAVLAASAGCRPQRREQPPKAAAPSGPCVVSGCSGQLCVDEAAGGGMFSTCEWKDEYACYKDAKCERQQDGRCGWTQDEKLKACLRP